MIPVFDTNIVIDCLFEYPQAAEELKRHERRYLSIIAWIEVITGAKTPSEEVFIRNFLADNFILVELEPAIAERAALIRRTYRLKLPDAIIWATAQHRNTLLVTRNSKDFPAGHLSIRVPYTL